MGSDRGPRAAASRWNQKYRSAASLDEFDWHDPSFPEEADMAIALLECERHTALDVGCGPGEHTAHLAGLFELAVGIDISTRVVRQARRRYESEDRSSEFVAAAVPCLPVRTASIGLVLDRGCFHLIDPADREPFLREAERMLEPGGCALLMERAAALEHLDEVIPAGLEIAWKAPTKLGRKDVPATAVILRRIGLVRGDAGAQI